MMKPTPPVINPLAIRNALLQNHHVSQFSKLGHELLETTERPNIITFAQFEPFMDLFMDRTKEMKKNPQIRYDRTALFERFRHELGINVFYPTIVVVSDTDATEVYFINRLFSRIKSDAVEGPSRRETLPHDAGRGQSVKRETLLYQAAIVDLAAANGTPEQVSYFQQLKRETVLLEMKHRQHNAPHVASPVKGVPASQVITDLPSFGVLDDDD